MKSIPLLAAGLGMIMTLLPAAGEGISFTLSAATARKVNVSTPEIYVTEFGDANGTFRHIGGVVANSSGVDNFSASVGQQTAGLHPGIKDAGTMLHVEFFVNEKGNGFGVVHQRPVEKAAVAAPAEKAAPRDTRPADQVALCGTAEWAVARGNTRLLEALLQAGLSINEPLDLETEWTALHYSAVQNQPRSAKTLIDHGADLEARCKYGKRPIDYAFERGKTDLCKILALPNRTEDRIGEYEEGLLEELFQRQNGPKDTVRFLSINGKDPNDEMMNYFRKLWPNVRLRSSAEEVQRDAQKPKKGTTSYRDRKTGDFGIIVEVTLEKTKGNSFTWTQREASGPSLSGGGNNGKISRRYGYWLKHDTSSWAE